MILSFVTDIPSFEIVLFLDDLFPATQQQITYVCFCVFVFFKTTYNKTIIRLLFCDILNNQDRR